MADDPNAPPQINGPQPNLQSLPNLGPTPQQQISGLPQLGQQSDQISQGLDTASQFYQQQLQANTPQQPSGGPVRNMLQRFFSGMGQSMMHEAGLPTQYEQQQKALTGLQNTANAKGMLALHGMMAAQYGTTPVQMPDGSYVNVLNRDLGKVYGAQAGAQSRLGAAEISGQAGIQKAQINQGMLMPVTEEMRQALGLPAGTSQIPLHQLMQAVGVVTRPETTVQGANDQYQYNRLTGQKTPLGVGNPRVAAIQERARLTPFDTVQPGTNIPETISNLQAIQTGAPKVPIGSQMKLGGAYAQYNDAYGILDKIDGLVGNGPGQVNVNDPAVRARLTAGYAALKDPQVTGMIARVAGPIASEFASNFLARQPIGSKLKPEERELLLTQLQGKAAATGLRGILGQSGSNEFQQRLDAGMFPGGQALANNDAIKQQTKATRSLLDRFQVGQPQAGLNAPNTPTNLRNKMAGDLGDAGGKPEGSTGKLPDGTKVVVRGGRIVKQ